MALTTQQAQDIARYWAIQNFVTPNVTAKYALNQVQAAAVAVDVAFDTTLSAAVVAVGGSTTIVNGLSAQITASMPAASAAQQTLLVVYVLMKRAGLI